MPRHARHTVRSLVFFFVATLGVVTVSLAGIGYLYTRTTLASQLDARMVNRMATLRADFARSGRPGLIAAIDLLGRRGARTFGYLLRDASGHDVAGVDGVGAVALGWSEVQLEDIDDGENDPARLLTTRLADGSTISVMADRDYIEQFDQALITYLVAAFGIILLLAGAGGSMLERIVRRRLEAIDRTARALIGGDRRSRVAISPRDDEFDALAGTINAMLDRLDGLLADVRRVTGYIAHDLRAPLVRLRAMLARGLEHGENRDRLIRDAIAASDELLEIQAAILQIGDVEADGGERFVAVDLSALLADLAESYAAVAEDSGHGLCANIAPAVAIRGDRTAIGQALINLFENALRHTPHGTAVTVSLAASAGHARIEVADRGRATSPAQRAAMLAGDRLEETASATREALGLRLVQAIVNAHGGTLTLRDNEPGLSIVITVPLDKPTG